MRAFRFPDSLENTMRWFVTMLALVALLATPAVFAQDAPVAAKCVEIDTASAKKLETLKGLGPKISKAIIAYRKRERTAATKDGRKTWNFRNWKTLMKVSGVGPKTCEALREQICFGGKVQKSCPK
jgi:competence ComEA-like helix-hairpin-helix protein